MIQSSGKGWWGWVLLRPYGTGPIRSPVCMYVYIYIYIHIDVENE